MKKRYIVLTALLATTLLAGCGETPKPHTGATDTEQHSGASESGNKDEDNKTQYLPDTSKKALEHEIAKNAKISLKKFDVSKSVFRFDKVTYQVPFSYARINRDFHFSLEDYGLTEDFKLEPGQRTTDNIRIYNTQVDYVVEVGLYNPYDVPVSVEDAMVWSITFSIEDSVDRPKIKLPAGIKWNSSLVDITLAYSDPTVPFTHDLETGLYTYTYMKDYKHYLTLYVDEEKGLVKFNVKSYN